MVHDRSQDVPSPIDLRTMGHARAWAEGATAARPAHQLFFGGVVGALQAMGGTPLRVIEPGSGPGCLAQRIL